MSNIIYTSKDVEQAFDNLATKPYMDIDDLKEEILSRSEDILDRTHQKINENVLYEIENQIGHEVHKILRIK
jgi:hypothetical protein